MKFLTTQKDTIFEPPINSSSQRKKTSIEGTKSKETLASLALGGYVHGVVAHAPRISWQRSTKGLPVFQNKKRGSCRFPWWYWSLLTFQNPVHLTEMHEKPKGQLPKIFATRLRCHSSVGIFPHRCPVIFTVHSLTGGWNYQTHCFLRRLEMTQRDHSY